MNISVKKLNGWSNVLDMARQTVNKNANGTEPSEEWKSKMLIAEHSPIKELRFLTRMKDIKTWVSQHVARHDFGGEHHSIDTAAVQYVATQRTDRTNVDRDNQPQKQPVNHSMTVNAQDLINMSRKRLCSGASTETRLVWETVTDSVKVCDPRMAEVMVPECVYKGFCPELNCCGYVNTEKFEKQLNKYRELTKR